MKKAIIFIEGMVLLVFLFSGCQPEEILPIEKKPAVNFSLPSAILDENNSEGIWVRLHLSQAAYEAGEVHIKQLNRTENSPFSTDPEISEAGIIKLPVEKGRSEIMFKVIPTNNETLNGHQEIHFRIDAVRGNLMKGSLEVFELIILDDELSGKLKAYETEGNTGYYRQEFTYNSFGQIQRSLWANGKHPAQIGQYWYHYDEQHMLNQIHSEPDRLTQILYYEGDKLVKNEKPAFSEVLDFETYSINETGLLEAIAYKKRHSNGFEEIAGYRTFSYFPNGNVESISYYVHHSPTDIELMQKITYSEYTVHDNPLPYFNGIPVLLYQPKLPGKIILEEQGETYGYSIDYVILGNGKVGQRKLRGIAGEEVTQYHYY